MLRLESTELAGGVTKKLILSANHHLFLHLHSTTSMTSSERKARPLRIALCQFASKGPKDHPENTQHNFDRLDGFVAQAAKERADLIVFPEYVLTGCAFPYALRYDDQVDESRAGSD